MANCNAKIFILNHTPEISLFLTWILYFFRTMHFPKFHINASTQILVKKMGTIKVSIMRKNFDLVVPLGNIVLNSMSEISVCLICILCFFRVIDFFQKLWRYFYLTIGQKVENYEGLISAKDFDWLIALGKFSFWTIYLI